MTHDPATTDPYTIVRAGVFKTNMFHVVVLVTGDMARDLLLYNQAPEKGKKGTNRKASEVVIKDYSLLMLSDQWYLSPDPIVLSEADGDEIPELNNGQHRLRAVVAASLEDPQIAVPFVIAFNSPKRAKWIMDQGKKRVPADWLTMYGEVNASQLSHAVRMLYALEHMQPYVSIPMWRRAKLTPESQQEFLDKHSDLRYALQQSRDTKKLFSSAVGAVLYYLMHREYGVWTTDQFFSGLATGAGLSIDDPRLKLREFLALKVKEGYKWDGYEQLAVLIATVNAWLLGQEKFVARHAFSKLSKHYPQLLGKEEMPVTRLTPGNGG